MPSELHEKLCEKGLKWLKRNGFRVSATNVWGLSSRERVDCIGFRHSCSVLIEAKVSRSDFLVDQNKPERQQGGAGTYRFYIAPEGLLTVDDLPDKWGLLEWSGRGIKETYRPTGNIWPSYEKSGGCDFGKFAHDSDRKADMALLFSIARKLAK